MGQIKNIKLHIVTDIKRKTSLNQCAMPGGCCGHSHGGGVGEQDDHKTLEELGSMYTLFQKIDLDNLECLNEETENSARGVFKPWHERLDTLRLVQSDCDEELLFNIPFTGSVKLKGIIVIGGEDSYHPAKMRLFKNRPHMTFDDAASEPDQEFDMQPDHVGALEYHTNVARFSKTEHLSIHFPSNFGEETTKVFYIGLKGDFSEAHKHGVTICNYEARANPSDHSVKEYNPSTHSVQ